MTFPINVNIPAANNDPADDQPEMLKNFANIASWLGVDHVAAGSPGAGLHKEVTFNSNITPTLPLTKGILFTKNAPSIPQLFYYTGNAAQSSTQYVQMSDGSTMLLGGIILKWGQFVLPQNNTHMTGPVVFPSDFPNNCFAVLVSLVFNSSSRSSSNNTLALVDSSVTVHQFEYVANVTNKTDFTSFYWAAIGN